MQKATRLKTAMCVLGCLGTAGHIQADVLLQYTMDSNLNPSTEASNITGTSIGALTDGTTSISYSSATPLENPTVRIDLWLTPSRFEPVIHPCVTLLAYSSFPRWFVSGIQKT